MSPRHCRGGEPGERAAHAAGVRLHTGDLSHLSKPEEFDTVGQSLRRTEDRSKVFYTPGEHDVFSDNGKRYLERYGKEHERRRVVQLRYGGVHFIGLVNVLDLKESGLGSLGADQLAWLEKDVRRTNRAVRRSSCSRISPLDGLPGMGMGHGRQRAGAGLPEEVRLGHGAEWAHPSGVAEGRGQCHISYGPRHGISRNRRLALRPRPAR